MTQKVLSYDLGGTKVAAGVVNHRGKILFEIRVPVFFDRGKEAVIQQLIDLGKQLITRFPDVSTVGIASAGPLDPKAGKLLDPTNFASSKGRWGIVPMTQIIRKALKLPTYLENDAAAAILAENWIGAAKKYDNAMILTLGTGLGTGILCNGKLLRSGKNLHPEAGHMIIHEGDTSAPCGCGNLGCAEAYLSGKNFEKRIQQRFEYPSLTAKEIAELARKKDPIALAAFDEYSRLMAIAIHNYVRIFNPEIVLFTGSFAKTADLFLPPTQIYLEKLLARDQDLLPKLSLSALQNEAGLLGGAFVALKKGKF